jgi:hypothetical protein
LNNRQHTGSDKVQRRGVGGSRINEAQHIGLNRSQPTSIHGAKGPSVKHMDAELSKEHESFVIQLENGGQLGQ